MVKHSPILKIYNITIKVISAYIIIQALLSCKKETLIAGYDNIIFDKTIKKNQIFRKLNDRS
jgi:exonuclease I